MFPRLSTRADFLCWRSATAKNNHHYFAEIWQQMENGGYEAMLYELLHRDISGFNVRSVPITSALQHQKKLSLPTPEAWWLEVLHRGYVFKSKLGLENYFGEWHEEVSTEILFASYSDFAERLRERHPLSREALGRFMRRVGAKPKRLATNSIVGEHLADIANGFGGTTRKAEPVKHPRPPGYHLGTLDDARAAFLEATRLNVDWQEPDESEP